MKCIPGLSRVDSKEMVRARDRARDREERVEREERVKRAREVVLRIERRRVELERAIEEEVKRFEGVGGVKVEKGDLSGRK